MIAFVTTMRHPRNADNYAHVENLLKDTLASVCAQTDRDFHVFVVGNQAPSFPLPDQVTFVVVDFPPPVAKDGPHYARAPLVWDKGTKMGIGLAAAREHNPDYVMIFDADDFVHRDLVKWVHAQPPSNGWWVQDGYMHSRSRGVYQEQPRLMNVCGTSYIVSWEAHAVSPTLTVNATQEEVANAFGERLEPVLGAHREKRKWLAARGYTLEPMPWKAAVYVVDSGENHSRKSMRGLAKPWSEAKAAEFGVPLTKGLVTAALAAYSPREIVRGWRDSDARRRRRQTKSARLRDAGVR